MDNKGITLRDFFAKLYYAGGSGRREVESYINYKIDSLNRTGGAVYSADTVIEGCKLYYYCGHDGESIFRDINDNDRVISHIAKIRSGVLGYYHFEYAIIDNGMVIIL